MPLVEVGRRRYFYRSERIDGRPVRLYVGSGDVAELAAATEDLRRLERAIEDREWRDEQAILASAEAPLLELCRATDRLARAALAVAGYFRHDRGEWRKRREHGR